jgi:hypothetical protein
MRAYTPSTFSAPKHEAEDEHEQEYEKHDEDDEKETCIPIRLLPCNHIAGHSCMLAWIKELLENASCPLCRTPIGLTPQPLSQKAINWICAHGPIRILDSALIPLMMMHKLPETLFRHTSKEVVNGLEHLLWLSLCVTAYLYVAFRESKVVCILRGVMWLWKAFVVGLFMTTDATDGDDEVDADDSDDEDSDEEDEDDLVMEDMIDEEVYIDVLNDEEHREEGITADDEKYWVLRGLPGAWH